MIQYWLVVGSSENWKISFENGSLWGLKPFREMEAMWNLLQEGDGLLYYVSGDAKGIVGCGNVTTKFRQTNPIWPEEISTNSVIWPLRFEFSTEYCLPDSLWKSGCFTDDNLRLITRMVFQCIPVSLVERTRIHFKLTDLGDSQSRNNSGLAISPATDADLSHDMLKKYLFEIGRIQGFIAEEEYPIEGNRLDVVWRRIERSVPTYAFEVQIGGDIYHALAKLKHAFDLWNSRIFIVARNSERARYEALVNGAFRELRDRTVFMEANAIAELYARKTSYFSFEKQLGIAR